MTTTLKFYASMGLWFTLGLVISILVFKPAKFELVIDSLSNSHFKSTTTIRLQPPERVLPTQS